MTEKRAPRNNGKRYSKEFIDRHRSQVVKLAQLGCTDKEIGLVTDMSEDALKTRLRAELDEGRGTLRKSLRKAQLEAAISEKNTSMLIWLGKCYLGQKEPKKELEHSGAITVEKVMFGKDKK